MKKIIGCIFVLLGLLVASCNKELPNIIKKEKIEVIGDLSFENYGFQTTTTYTKYTDDTYMLRLNYQKEDSLAVSVKIDSTVMVDYNKLYGSTYKLLPQKYYSFPEKITVKKGSTQVPVHLDVKKIMDEIGLDKFNNYTIPLLAETTKKGFSISRVGGSVLLNVVLKEPNIVFPGETSNFTLYNDVSNGEISIIGSYSFRGFDKTKFSTVVNVSKVAAFNTKNGTNYKELPSSTGFMLQEITDSIKKNVTIGFNKIDARDLSGVYLLPVDLISDDYKFEPAATLYYVITVKKAPLKYESIVELSTVQAVATGTATPQEFTVNFADLASRLKTTKADLIGKATLYGIGLADRITRYETYTTSTLPGFWFDKSGVAVAASSSSKVLSVEYKNDSILKVTPTLNMAPDQYKVSLALEYNHLMVRYNITLNIAYFNKDLSVTRKASAGYASTDVVFDKQAAANVFGVSTDDFKKKIVYSILNTDGSIGTNRTTGGSGYWLSDTGSITNWGKKSVGTKSVVYVNFDNDHTFQVGQFPGFSHPGDVYKYKLLIGYRYDPEHNDYVKYGIYNLTVTMN